MKSLVLLDADMNVFGFSVLLLIMLAKLQEAIVTTCTHDVMIQEMKLDRKKNR